MAKKGNFLTDEQVSSIKRILDDYKAGTLKGESDEPEFVAGQKVETYIVKLEGNLDRIRGLYPSTASCLTYRFDEGSAKLVEVGDRENIYNINFQKYRINSFVAAVREPISGKLFALHNNTVNGVLDGVMSNDCCCGYSAPAQLAVNTDCPSVGNLMTYSQFAFMNLANHPEYVGDLGTPSTIYEMEYDGSCIYLSDDVEYDPVGDGNFDSYHWELDLSIGREPGECLLNLIDDNSTYHHDPIGPLTYENKSWWDGIHCTKFRLISPRWELPYLLQKYAPCEICYVTPYSPTYIEPAACMIAAAEFYDRDLDTQPWPTDLFVDVQAFDGTWLSENSTGGVIGWAQFDPNNASGYQSWGKIPLCPSTVPASYDAMNGPHSIGVEVCCGTLVICNVIPVGSVNFGGSNWAVALSPTLTCAGADGLRFNDGAPLSNLTGGAYNPMFRGMFPDTSTNYWGIYFDGTGPTTSLPYGGGASQGQIIDPGTKKIDFTVWYELFANPTTPPSPQVNGYTPHSGASWKVKVHIYEQ